MTTVRVRRMSCPLLITPLGQRKCFKFKIVLKQWHECLIQLTWTLLTVFHVSLSLMVIKESLNTEATRSSNWQASERNSPISSLLLRLHSLKLLSFYSMANCRLNRNWKNLSSEFAQTMRWTPSWQVLLRPTSKMSLSNHIQWEFCKFSSPVYHLVTLRATQPILEVNKPIRLKKSVTCIFIELLDRCQPFQRHACVFSRIKTL